MPLRSHNYRLEIKSGLTTVKPDAMSALKGITDGISSTWQELVGMNVRQLLLQGINLGRHLVRMDKSNCTAALHTVFGDAKLSMLDGEMNPLALGICVLQG